MQQIRIYLFGAQDNMGKLQKEIAEPLHKKIFVSKLLGLAVLAVRPFVGYARKAFGDLIYKDTEEFDFSYYVVTNEESYKNFYEVNIMPMISVIMPVYNAEKTIKAAIDSVLTQTFDDLELIVVNDFSKDKSEEIIKELAKSDTRIKYYKNEKNIGASETRNFALSKATGKWIAFLDSDDMWKPEKLEKQLEIVKNNPDARLIYTASAFINDNGDEFSYILEAEEKTSYKDILKGNLLSCSSVMISADIMKDFKMPGDYLHEDYYIWLNVLQKIDYAYGVNEPLLIYRLSSNSKSSNRIKSAKMTYQTYRHVGYNCIAAFFLTFRYAFYSIHKRLSIKASKI